MTPADVAEVVRVQRAGAVANLTAIFDQSRHPFSDDLIEARWRPSGCAGPGSPGD